MDWYFNTLGLTWGVILLLVAGIVLFLLVAVVLERRTKHMYPEHRKPKDDGEDGLFDFDDE